MGGRRPPYGFGPAGGDAWLPRPGELGAAPVAAQTGVPTPPWSSTAARCGCGATTPAWPARTTRCWLDAAPGVLAFSRRATPDTPELVCVVNISAAPVRSAGTAGSCSTSAPPTEVDGEIALPVDAAAWFERE